VASDGREKILFLVETVNELLQKSPGAHICIVCRHKHEVEDITGQLKGAVINADIRTGYNKNFVFTPGVTVTNLNQIKGLEFDSVIIMDPSEVNYPNDAQGRRYLYTAITRAKENIVLIGETDSTSLLDGAADSKLIDTKDVKGIEPIIFSEEDEEPF
jgi:DNA helicase IV